MLFLCFEEHLKVPQEARCYVSTKYCYVADRNIVQTKNHFYSKSRLYHFTTAKIFVRFVIWESTYKVRIAWNAICTVRTTYSAGFTDSTGVFFNMMNSDITVFVGRMYMDCIPLRHSMLLVQCCFQPMTTLPGWKAWFVLMWCCKLCLPHVSLAHVEVRWAFWKTNCKVSQPISSWRVTNGANRDVSEERLV